MENGITINGWVVIVIILFFFFFLGIRIVRPTHRGLVERLGRYHRFANPGFIWILPFIDKIPWTTPLRMTHQAMV